MKAQILLLILCLSLVSVSTAADVGSEWSVTIYDHGTNQLVTMTMSGVDVTELPDVGYLPREPFESNSRWYVDFTTSVEMTNDRRYLISLVQRTEPYVREAIITDLVTNETRLVSTPPLADSEVFVGYGFGAFNPEMTDVTLSYVSHDVTSGFGCCDSGGMVIVDLATGTITHLIDVDALFNHSTAWVDDWTSAGIWFSPRCSACTPPHTYIYKQWNPRTNTISDTNIFHDHLYSERLKTTGELLYSENHPAFPLGGESFPLRLNVVSVYQSGDDPPSAPGQIVYYDTEHLDFDARAHWIMAGMAFLVTSDRRRNVVVMRDGRQLAIEYDNEEYFIATTGYGWLTIDRETNNISHYNATGEIVTKQVMYQARGEIIVANIQSALPIEELALFSFEVVPPDVVFCPGALPTRLQVGDWAEVIVDHQELGIGSLLGGDVEFVHKSYDNLEMLPLGAHVQILDGPACEPYGWSYVKVAYQDKTGWLLEIYQTSYYLAPVPHQRNAN